MSEWLNPPYYTLPAPEPEYYMNGPFIDVRFAVDYGMGLAIDGDLKDPNNKFNNNPALDAFYHDPISYAKNLVAYAEALKANPKYHKPEGWDPVESGLAFANTVFGIIRQIPCNRGDAGSNNLFDSWAAGTGQEYGGHPPVGSSGDGVNAETAAHPVEPGQNVSVLGVPQV